MTTFKIVHELSETHKTQLLELYQHEWWSIGRTKEDVEAILAGSSFVIGIVEQDTHTLVGFSRMLTDFFKYAYVYDVIVAKDYRGLGLGNLLLKSIIEHPKLNHITNIELVYRKAFMPFYEKFGFSSDYGESVAMRRQEVKT